MLPFGEQLDERQIEDRVPGRAPSGRRDAGPRGARLPLAAQLSEQGDKVAVLGAELTLEAFPQSRREGWTGTAGGHRYLQFVAARPLQA